MTVHTAVNLLKRLVIAEPVMSIIDIILSVDK